MFQNKVKRRTAVARIAYDCPVSVSGAHETASALSAARISLPNSVLMLLLMLLQQSAEKSWAQRTTLSHCCSDSPCSMISRVMPYFTSP